MHLSFCGWGVLISAGCGEMSQNTCFLNVGKETSRERDTQAEKQQLHKDVKEYGLYSEGVTPLWLTYFTLRTQELFLSPRHQRLGENDSLTVRSGRLLCTFHIRETEKGHMWFDWNGLKKKPPITHISQLGGGCVNPTLKAPAFTASDRQ